jgi:hypothetical protein
VDKARVNVDLKIVGGERIPLHDLAKRHELVQQIE